MALIQRAHVMWEALAADEVHAPHFHRVEAEPVGRDVHEAFAHEVDLEAPWRTVGSARSLVGHDASILAAVCGPAVRTGKHRHAETRHSHAMRADIGACVV